MLHQDIDKRSLALHRLVCEKIRQSPELMAIAHKNHAKQVLVHAGYDSSAGWYLHEWKKILNLPLDDCFAKVLDETEYGNMIRQASPFSGVLSNAERMQFFNEWTP